MIARELMFLSLGWLALTGATAHAAAPAAAIKLETLDLSGDFDDGGTVVTAGENPASETPSLGAILQLAFDPKAASTIHEQTALVRLKQTGDALAVETIDADGQVIWRAKWLEGEEYSRTEHSVTLRFRSPRSPSDEVLLVLEPAAGNRLLQVSVQLREATLFGPRVTSKGVFLFGRA